jgi:hypothetical protein
LKENPSIHDAMMKKDLKNAVPVVCPSSPSLPHPFHTASHGVKIHDRKAIYTMCPAMNHVNDVVAMRPIATIMRIA